MTYLASFLNKVDVVVHILCICTTHSLNSTNKL